MFLTFHNRQPSEPAIKHPVPPWSLVPQESWNKVAADLFRLYGHYCLLVVDYNSKFVTIEISQFLTVINKCKSQYGIPKKLIINNGLEFTSHHFKKFSKSWDLKLQTVSSRHHQLNGLVERSIKTVKQTFKKAKYDETRQYLALLFLNLMKIEFLQPKNYLTINLTQTYPHSNSCFHKIHLLLKLLDPVK